MFPYEIRATNERTSSVKLVSFKVDVELQLSVFSGGSTSLLWPLSAINRIIDYCRQLISFVLLLSKLVDLPMNFLYVHKIAVHRFRAPNDDAFELEFLRNVVPQFCAKFLSQRFLNPLVTICSTMNFCAQKNNWNIARISLYWHLWRRSKWERLK